MAVRNQLFFIVFALLLLSGCGTAPTLREPAGPVRVAPAENAGMARPAPVLRPESRSADPEMLFVALAAAGVDYRSGGRSHQAGFDCSGLVAFVFHEAYGLALPHSTLAQSKLGEPIDASVLQPGDLVFFNTQRKPYSHVGIYVGEGRFIHAPRKGSVVRTENMRAPYWATRFDGARRIAPVAVTADYLAKPRRPVVTYP